MIFITADVCVKKDPVSSIVPLLPSSSRHISSLSFPKHSGHGIGGGKEGVSIQVKPFSESDLKKETPFLDLKASLHA
jgi:hypothetical protein